MNFSIFKSNRRTTSWSGEFFSARFFLLRALALGALFLTVHVAGLREYTTFISGTTINPAVSFSHCAFLGMIYLVSYMGCIVVAPVLVLAAGLLRLWETIQLKFTT